MPIQSANSYQSAINLISAHQGAVFEVTKDGGIREQTGFEKFKLFASKLVRSYDSKRDSKDAAVASALTQLHRRDGGSSPEPLHNSVSKRFFDAQRRIDERTAKRADNLKLDNDNIDRFKTQSIKKTEKERSEKTVQARKIEVQAPAKAEPKKTLADYAHLAPRAVVLDDQIQFSDPTKLKGVLTEKQFRNLLQEDPQLAQLVGEARKKFSNDAHSVTAQDYRWLHPEDKLLNRDERFTKYTPARIQKANIIFNDRLKLALFDIAKKNGATGARPSPADVARASKNLEGIWGRYDSGPLDYKGITSKDHRVDFNAVQILLGEYDLVLGEGDLAQFDGADFDVVKWSESVGEAPIPRNAKSPLVLQDLNESGINDRAISEIPFDQRSNGIKL